MIADPRGNPLMEDEAGDETDVPSVASLASAGTLWQEHGLVFPRVDGSWWNPPAVSLAFRRAVKTTGVPKIRFHDLRHTHATLLLRAGVNPKVVSERLGHSSVAFTLDTYARDAGDATRGRGALPPPRPWPRTQARRRPGGRRMNAAYAQARWQQKSPGRRKCG